MRILIKDRLRRANLGFVDIAKSIGVTYNALYARTKNPTFKSLTEIAEAIPCNVHELIEPGKGYVHLYDDEKNEWLGIHKL